MTITVDRRIAELLCSRICHELVAGVAAINNGVELISEIDPSMFDEAMGLIGSSAKQASARVQYYRMAYGFAGNDALASMSAAIDLVRGLFETEERFSLEMPGTQPPRLEPGWGKLMLNLVVLGMECLPRGGTIAPAVTESGGKALISVSGKGVEARIPDRYAGILSRNVAGDEVSALNVHAYYTSALAEDIGDGLKLDARDGLVSIQVLA
jgi:histidine phosphotransferase ChpT